MGIDISTSKTVTYNASHDKLLITSDNKNPTECTVDGLRVRSIFQRVRSRDRKGDGNPFIYALKAMRGFSVSSSEIRKLLPGFNSIINKALAGDQYDLVVPMPSTHRISEILGERAVRISGSGVLSSDLLRKKNIAEVLAELKIISVPKKSKKDANRLRADLEKCDGLAPFSMKDVPVSLRPFIQPLVIAKNLPPAAPNILLTDDLMSTGSTLISARDSLLAIFPEAQIGALCLLSRIE